MTIILTGGGSGGHITPLVAVAQSLKKINKDVILIYIGHKNDKINDRIEMFKVFDRTYLISAGKFRRYHGKGIWQVFDLGTLYKNFKDLFNVLKGIKQSRSILKKEKPGAVFIKGGFVGLPVGIAAKTRNIAYITHDSDTLPGLANRIIGKWAKVHAVAMPKELYNYPQDKTVTTGIPIGSEFSPVNANQKVIFRQLTNIPTGSKVLLVTGGGLGAERLNNAVVSSSTRLLENISGLYIIHLTGINNYENVKKQYDSQLKTDYKEQVIIVDFTTELYKYSGAADLIITRAGATALAEFAAQNKPCILVPNPILTGGHQIKNALALSEMKAVEVLPEEGLDSLAELVASLISNNHKLDILAANFSRLVKVDASDQIANLLLGLVPTLDK